MKEKLEKEFLFTPETSTLGKIKTSVFGAVVYILWAAFIIFLYKSFIPEYRMPGFNPFQESREHLFIASCIYAPFFEELVFRSWLGWFKSDQYTKYTLYLVLLSSLFFGYAHNGAWSIPIQGVGGIIFSYVYLKNGYSYLSAVFTHFLINFYYFIN